MSATLTTARLGELEGVIERGLATFVEVGQALLEIRDSRLYRETHRTFEAYCRERWAMSKSHANRQIDAAVVARLLTPTGVIPANEAQARELAPLLRDGEAELLATVRELRVSHGDGVTAKAIRTAVASRVRARRQRPTFRSVSPPVGAYAVLYADPPWRYEHPVSTSRAIENQYPTMTLGELLDLQPPAAPDSVLFMWATSPKLADALTLMSAWGFEYRTCMVWVKDRIGMGYYARQQHELLLIGRRGKLGVPREPARPASVIYAPRARHSEKPKQVYGVIEAMYPDATRIEMFARSARPDWDAWGNEAPEAA